VRCGNSSSYLFLVYMHSRCDALICFSVSFCTCRLLVRPRSTKKRENFPLINNLWVGRDPCDPPAPFALRVRLVAIAPRSSCFLRTCRNFYP